MAERHPANEVRVLDSRPPTLTRTIGLLEGRGYIVAFPWVEETIYEREGADGRPERLETPEVRVGHRPTLIRDDGAIFADNPGQGEQAMSVSGLSLNLAGLPPIDKAISWPAVKQFHDGRRPAPAAAYRLLRLVIGKFVDLGVLGGYDELIACWVMATYSVDAFGVFGYLWINGVSGSGKTQLLSVIAELSCLGMMVTPGSSYATLRDVASLGATLCLDDAEKVLDSRTDPEKVALLLSGNRRGASTTVKQPEGMRGWANKYINIYAPRAFSAIALPTSAMARRCIIIPMTRSTDPARANSDPTDYDGWGISRRALLDLLWMVALANITKMPDYDRNAAKLSGLTGAALAPWRAVLAVALWLEEAGVQGLFQRMNCLAHDYQRQRTELEPDNLVSLVVGSLRDVAVPAPNGTLVIETSTVTDRVKELAGDELGIDAREVTPKKVGRALSQLGLRSVPRPGGKGGRRWGLSPSQLDGLERAFGHVREPQEGEAETPSRAD